MNNIFQNRKSPPVTDADLVSHSLHGNQDALEALVRRHQSWVYNLALRMFGHPEDAEDITQEVLVKMTTKLSTFAGHSAFRTWLWRIAVNHCLTMRKRRMEKVFRHFVDYGRSIDESPDSCPDGLSPEEDAVLNDEVRLHCMMGMLLCLDRKQRLIFILGELFGVGQEVGAEVFEISPDDFRQRLSRARKRIAAFTAHRCSLVNPANPCHCRQKIGVMLQCGAVVRERPVFHDRLLPRLREIAEAKLDAFNDLWSEQCRELFANQPFYSPPDFASRLRTAIHQPQILEFADFEVVLSGGPHEK